MWLAYSLSDRLAAVAGSAGLVEPGDTPLRNIPVLDMVGARDDRFLVLFGFLPTHSLPLEPASFLAIPGVTASMTAAADDFGLLFDPHTEVLETNSTTYRFDAPAPGNTAGNTLDTDSSPGSSTTGQSDPAGRT